MYYIRNNFLNLYKTTQTIYIGICLNSKSRNNKIVLFSMKTNNINI